MSGPCCRALGVRDGKSLLSAIDSVAQLEVSGDLEDGREGK